MYPDSVYLKISISQTEIISTHTDVSLSQRMVLTILLGVQDRNLYLLWFLPFFILLSPPHTHLIRKVLLTVLLKYLFTFFCFFLSLTTISFSQYHCSSLLPNWLVILQSILHAVDRVTFLKYTSDNVNLLIKNHQ